MFIRILYYNILMLANYIIETLSTKYNIYIIRINIYINDYIYNQCLSIILYIIHVLHCM